MSILSPSHTSARTRAGALAVPHVGTTVAVSCMAAVSLAPGLLPRAAALQGAFSGILVAIGLLAMWALEIAARTVLPTHRRDRRRDAAWRTTVLGLGTTIVAVSVAGANSWQNSLRMAMGTSPIGILYWTEAILVATLTTLVLCAVGIGVRRTLRRLGFVRGVGAGALFVLGLQLFVAPTLWHAMTGAFDRTNSYVDTALTQPLSISGPGGPESLTPWSSLGAEGRIFVSHQGATSTAPVRVYAGLDSAPDTPSRAALAVTELERIGGFARGNIVVAVPTGSGWVDTNAIDGIEQRFHGDVSTIAQQYSDMPSWATFLFRRDEAENSATALFTAVGDHIAALAPADRPNLYLYGQSLGAVGGSAALAAESPTPVCGALWAGPPARATHQDGVTVLANTSDPVVWWSTDLMFDRPDLSRAVQDAPIPRWIPGVTFLQTSVDMLGSLGVPAGHGHRYGTEQGTALPRCAPLSTAGG
ncbi:putative membrane protein [Rhodococcus sp. 27YEA15]|uniref:alpha/beta-hydrolase family protein n=1 Tax=Rhodococcus sp. 27YEA15 TaxID=3156259 RepID=UPI003C7E51DF